MKPYLSPDRPHVLAHRGLADPAGHDENTIPAFQAALKAGATHIETDVQVTADGVAVLFHDRDLARTGARAERVDELTIQELKTLRLKQGGTVPTLVEALEALPSARFNIDIKSNAGCKAAAQAINATRAWDRVLIASFSSLRVRRTASLFDQPVCLSPGASTIAALYFLHLFSARPLARALTRGFAVLQVPVSSGAMRFATRSFIAFAHSVGLMIHFWTINTPAQMRELLALGADGIVTDRSDIAAAELV